MDTNRERAGTNTDEGWIESCQPGPSELEDFVGPGGLPAGSIEPLARRMECSLRTLRRERARLQRRGRRSLEAWLSWRVRVEDAEPLVESCREGRPVLVTLPFTRSALAALMYLAVRLNRSLVAPRYPILDALVAPWVDGVAARPARDPGVPRIMIIPPSVSRGLEILQSPATLMVTFPDLWHRSWPAAKATLLGRPIRASVYEGLLRARVPDLRIFFVASLGGRRGVHHLLRVARDLSREETPNDDLQTIEATACRLLRMIEETAKNRPHDLLSWRSLRSCLETSQLVRLRIEAGMIRSCLVLLEVQDPAMSSRAALVRSLAEVATRALREAVMGNPKAGEAFRERAHDWEQSLRTRTT